MKKQSIAIVLIALILMFSIIFLLINSEETEEEKTLSGFVFDAYETENPSVWNITLTEEYRGEDKVSYLMNFTNNVSPPPEDVQLKFYYTKNSNIYVIYRVKSI